MGKTFKALEESRQKRQEWIRYFGEIPTSILKHQSTVRAEDSAILDGRSYGGASISLNKKGESKIWKQSFLASGRGTRGKGKGLSRASQNIGTILVKLYSKEGDIIIDPFVGPNSRMEMCFRLGRHYKGQDISQDFISRTEKVKQALVAEYQAGFQAQLWPEEVLPTVELVCGDSRVLQFKDQSGDFTITSPPYWDLEHYGDEPEQLGKSTYKGFLQNLQQVIRENYRCLKAGSFCCWLVNDFRKGNTFYSYHSDVITLFREAGFIQHDIAILELGALAASFADFFLSRKILPKRHEYALIFRKPK